MRLLPSLTTMRRVVAPTQPVARAGAGDSLGRGMDTVVTLVVFLGIGWLLDRWLGTTPWFMIALFLLAGAGSFVVLKARYTAQMEALEAERIAAASAHRRAAADVTGHGRGAGDVPMMQGSPTPVEPVDERAAS